MKSRYIHFSVFKGSALRHGGTKRSEQLVEILSDAGVESYNPVQSLKEALKFSISHPFLLLRSFPFSLYLLIFKGVSLRAAFSFLVRSVYPIYLIGKLKPDVVIQETVAGFSILFMQYMRQKKINYVAVPHNIEFMVPCQKPLGFRSLAYAFSCEIDGYKAAVAVKTICEYDKSITDCLGVTSSVFPYYPIENDLKEFDEIRQIRLGRHFDATYLALGTVGNKPTYEGVKSLLEYKISSDSQFDLIVAGYGTEQFEHYNQESISVLGAIGAEMLHDLLVSSKALLINQPQTTGFLTKIVEFNLCGIPIGVLSDYLQAKNMEEYGVYRMDVDDVDIFDPKQPSVFFQKPSVKDLLV